MKIKVLFLILTIVCPCNLLAQDQCKFDYWELIPDSSECEVLHLPDFDFRKLPEDPKIALRLKRFCQNFEISFDNNSMQVTYCKQPETDGTGPEFEVKGKMFLADLNFEGCYNKQRALGRMFVLDGWDNPPPNIKRIWRIKDRKLKPPNCSE